MRRFLVARILTAFHENHFTQGLLFWDTEKKSLDYKGNDARASPRLLLYSSRDSYVLCESVESSCR
jgi:hypothetical protein